MAKPARSLPPVIIDWPDDWTPLFDILDTFEQAVAAYNLVCPPGDEVTDWRLVLLFLWVGDQIEFGGRLGRPDAPFAVIAYPKAERRPAHFALDLVGQARLLHRTSQQVYYDLHVRLRRRSDAELMQLLEQYIAANPNSKYDTIVQTVTRQTRRSRDEIRALLARLKASQKPK